MGFINDGTLKDWQNGETVQATDYKRERELLRIAINDNFQRIKNAADSVTGVTEEMKGLQALFSSLQTQINNLDDMYSTDAERIAAINEVIKQFEIADGKLENLINNKANKSDVYTKVESDDRYMQGIPDKSITRQKLADDFISEINTAKGEAHTEAVYAKDQGDYAKKQGDRAKKIVDEIESGSGVVSVNNKQGVVVLNADDVGAIPADQKGVAGGIATINEKGQVLDGDGNPVEGKMKTVNHIGPDEEGNVDIDVQTPVDNALKKANAYTDQAIANANQGEVKMVYYPYVIKATTANQTEFTIPLESFNVSNDFLQVVQNTTVLNKEEHYTVTGKTITLNQGVTTGTSLFITIIKNTLIGAEGAVNGNLIKDGSLPLNKLAEPVVTSVNGQTGDINLAIPTKTSELTNDSNFATTENISAVSTNLKNHESQIASTTELGHVKVDGETINISEEGVLSLNTTSLNTIPSGLISLWSGAVDTIPSGWVLCDGQNNTPDLRNRFIVGAGSKYDVGAKGGQDSVILDITQIPAHQHSSGTLATNQAGSHQHSMKQKFGLITSAGSGSEEAYRYLPGYEATMTDVAGAHTHSISGSTANTGGGTSHENRPPFYALAYIMKL